MRIFVVEDEPKLAAVLADYLHQAGHEVQCFEAGDSALEAARARQPDLVLLDVMLPGLDGLSVLRALREFSQVPVIMVTARIDEVDRILGLELGADDYVCKPFSPREVVARVTAQLRRAAFERAQDPDRTADTGGVTLAQEELRARVDGRVVDLTPVEFRLLDTLVSAPGRVFSRQQLMDAAYTDHRVVSDRTIDTHVKNLRRKLAEALGAEPPLGSVYGVGYRWDPFAGP
ncbi:MAG: response regulator [Pseudomonadales bacterium]|jgi:two-component system response regulator BaeR|nr:response regulator [Pseudomonadales bacterium]